MDCINICVFTDISGCLLNTPHVFQPPGHRPQRVPGRNGSQLPVATTSLWAHSSSAFLHSLDGLSPPLLWIRPGVPSLINQHVPGDGFPDGNSSQHLSVRRAARPRRGSNTSPGAAGKAFLRCDSYLRPADFE